MFPVRSTPSLTTPTPFLNRLNHPSKLFGIKSINPPTTVPIPSKTYLPIVGPYVVITSLKASPILGAFVDIAFVMPVPISPTI